MSDLASALAAVSFAASVLVVVVVWLHIDRRRRMRSKSLDGPSDTSIGTRRDLVSCEPYGAFPAESTSVVRAMRAVDYAARGEMPPTLVERLKYTRTDGEAWRKLRLRIPKMILSGELPDCEHPETVDVTRFGRSATEEICRVCGERMPKPKLSTYSGYRGGCTNV